MGVQCSTYLRLPLPWEPVLVVRLSCTVAYLTYLGPHVTRGRMGISSTLELCQLNDLYLSCKLPDDPSLRIICNGGKQVSIKSRGMHLDVLLC